MNIFIGEQAKNFLIEVEKNVTPFMSEVGGVYYENGWWVGYKIVDYNFDFDQFSTQEEALRFARS